MTTDRVACGIPVKRISWLPIVLSFGVWIGADATAQTEPRFTALVFSKTTGFRHDSIPQGIASIEALGKAHAFAVDSTEDGARFTDAELARFIVVV